MNMHRPSSRAGRRLLAAVVVSLAVAAAPTAWAGSGGCAARFPGSTFETAYPAGPVMVHGSGLTEPVARRFASEIERLAVMVHEDMGGIDDAAVCVFADRIPVDAEALGWHPGHRLPAVVFGDEGIVALSAVRVGHVADGARRGLIHIAQWRATEGTYPAMLADDVLGWYRNRLDGSVAAVHEMFVRQNVGQVEPWPPFPWLDGPPISDTVTWDPVFGYGGMGAFTAFAVSRAGTSVLVDPLGSDIAGLDEAWRVALFEQSGSIPGGSREWVIGAVMVAMLVGLAVFVALMARREKRRVARIVLEASQQDAETRKRALEEQAAVRPSVPGSGRRAHPGVRGAAPGGGVDGNDRDRPPSGRGIGTAVDDVTASDEAGDDMFRHPDFDREG
jgi:hypothetical protein